MYKNIRLTESLEEANFVTHSGKFHVDEVMATVFLSKINDNIILFRTPSTQNLNLNNKLVYDIGYGKFDHHQKNRNGKRKEGIYYSSMGLLWKEYGKFYLKKLNVNDIDSVFNYIDEELIKYIDAADNMQFEYLENKIMPDFIKLCNPEWNEEVSENEAFMNAVTLADSFWNLYIKHAIAEVEAINIILEKIDNSKECYIYLDKEMPFRKLNKHLKNNKVKYLIFKSRREGYDVRTLLDCKFKDEVMNLKDIIYLDNNRKLCCTKTKESAIKIIEFNENKC